MARSSRNLAVIAFVIVILIAGAAVFARSREISHSVEQLFLARLELSYNTEVSALDRFETDRRGIWWVVTEPSISPDNIALEPRLSPADSADQEYYKKIFVEQFSPSFSLDEFGLFRGEVRLGRETMCEQTTCNVVLLAKFGSPDVFVEISEK